MGTRSTKLVLLSDDVERGWFGKRFGLKAKLAAGLAILGVTATLAFGGVPRGDTARSQPQAAHSAASLVDWERAERTQVAPAQPAGSGAAPLAPPQFGPQEYLPGEEPGSGGGIPSPVFGPQP
jgi:hypothetical protein